MNATSRSSMEYNRSVRAPFFLRAGRSARAPVGSFEGLGDEGVGGGVAPEDEGVFPHVLGGDVGGFFDTGGAAHEGAPAGEEVLGLGLDPGGDLRGGAVAFWEDDDEGVHEALLDGAGLAGALGERESGGVCGGAGGGCRG